MPSVPDPSSAALNFARDGAQLFSSALNPGSLVRLGHVLANAPRNRPGVRLHGIDGLVALLGSEGPIGSLAASILGSGSRPVRALLFDKTPEANWALGWHQDRTVCVAARTEVDGFGSWTIKDGRDHVEPPVEILAAMVTLRVHLDPVSPANAPLLIAPASHRLGRLLESEIDEAVARCGSLACEAEAGDVWLYATLILHASPAALEPARRRVLQIDYAARDLPGGLEWLGI